MQRQVSKAQTRWEHTCWHFSNRRFACEADALAALEHELKGKPAWLDVQRQIIAHPQYGGKGRPFKEARPTGYQWQLMVSVSVNYLQVVQEVLRKACWIVGTNVLEPAALSDEALIGTYKDQGGVERGFRFLKDPLFLASSVTVSKPERVMALSFSMVLCLLVYRLAEHLLRRQLVATEQTFPNQVNKPIRRTTMRWIFQCFEGIDLLHIRIGSRWHTQVLGLQALHQQVLRLLGPVYSQLYFFSP